MIYLQITNFGIPKTTLDKVNWFFYCDVSFEMGILCQSTHYVILAAPSSLFLMQRQKNHQKIGKRKGKQTFL
jgi:hypothetical protein